METWSFLEIIFCKVDVYLCAALLGLITRSREIITRSRNNADIYFLSGPIKSAFVFSYRVVTLNDSQTAFFVLRIEMRSDTPVMCSVSCVTCKLRST